MRPARKVVPKSVRLASRRWRSDLQHRMAEARRRWHGDAVGPECVLLILGCQRSGTTMLTHVFSRDTEAKVFGEYSVLSSRDPRDQLRLDALESVSKRLERSRFPLLVMKPLVESQWSDRMLDTFPSCRALWLVRGPGDVASSNLARFGKDNGHKNVQRLIAGERDDWRAERVSAATRNTVKSIYSPTMDALDAAALFWWARNALYFELGLDRREDVLPIRYEALVQQPVETMASIYAFAGRCFPGASIVESVSTKSVGRTPIEQLSEPVRGLCESMLTRLDGAIERWPACA